MTSHATAEDRNKALSDLSRSPRELCHVNGRVDRDNTVLIPSPNT